jgi:hypothetical protein
MTTHAWQRPCNDLSRVNVLYVLRRIHSSASAMRLATYATDISETNFSTWRYVYVLIRFDGILLILLNGIKQ